jgi:hypothetical protein
MNAAGGLAPKDFHLSTLNFQLTAATAVSAHKKGRSPKTPAV